FIGRSIVALQLATTMVLLIGAGLLGRSLMRVLSVDPGFRTEHVVTVDLPLPSAYSPQQKVQRLKFLNELFSRTSALPGVSDVGGTTSLPLGTGISGNGSFAVVNPQQVPPATQAIINRAAQGDVTDDSALMKELIDFFQQLFRDPSTGGS